MFKDVPHKCPGTIMPTPSQFLKLVAIAAKAKDIIKANNFKLKAAAALPADK